VARRQSATVSTSGSTYARFLRELKLIGLGLSKCSVELNREGYADLRASKASTRKIAAEYKILEIGEDFFEAAGRFVLSISDGKQLRPLHIECQFDAHFHPPAPLDEELIRRFVSSELKLIIWPYFRQFVSDITGKMAIQPITIPLSTVSEDNQ